MSASKHPIQPMVTDSNGTLRFKQNAIVRHLLDWAQVRGMGLNELAYMEFPQEDREQFAQLIGYSLSGFSELEYVRGETYLTAEQMAETGMDERDARITSLERTLGEVRKGIREAATAVFSIHPDDLHE